LTDAFRAHPGREKSFLSSLLGPREHKVYSAHDARTRREGNMAKCPSCHKETNDDVEVCPFCGQDFNEPPVEKKPHCGTPHS
jgi:hypothetical protein